MSEYQYYEFRAIDRPLTTADQQYLRSLSTRAEITSRRFTNEYHWGDFKGSPLALMHRCFDLHTYWANWGTRIFMIRLPGDVIPASDAKRYAGPALEFDRKGDHVVATLQNPDDDWDEEWDGEDVYDRGWAGELEPVRDLLLSGDRRPFYIAWLAGVPYGKTSAREPPVPAGLKNPPKCLRSLIEYLGVQIDLYALAADRSVEPPSEEDKAVSAAKWIKSLTSAQKDDYLLQTLLSGPDAATPVSRAFLKYLRTSKPVITVPSPETAGNLLKTAQLMETRRLEEAAEKKRIADAKRAKAEREKRAAHLRELAADYDAHWRAVDKQVLLGVKEYPAVVKKLVDLRDSAEYANGADDFAARLRFFLSKYHRRSSLIELMEKANLDVGTDQAFT